MTDAQQHREDVAAMLEFFALKLRNGEPCVISIQAIYNVEGEGSQIYAGALAGAPIDKIHLLGVMQVQQLELATNVNNAGGT